MGNFGHFGIDCSRERKIEWKREKVRAIRRKREEASEKEIFSIHSNILLYPFLTFLFNLLYLLYSLERGKLWIEDTLESRIIVPPPPHPPTHPDCWFFDFMIPSPSPPPPPTPLSLVFSHFCSHFWVEIAIFTIVHHKEKESVQSSTITMNYVNTKHILSLWDPIVGISIV